MKRVTLLIIGVLTLCGIGLTVSPAMAIDGPLANASVSFGEWKTDPPLDRILADPGAGVGNLHQMIPQIATIKQHGAVNFIISGGHVVAIYDDGTQPEDINLTNVEVDNPATMLVNEACNTMAGGILSDSNNRIYRGPCLNNVNTPATSFTRRDGVEVVQFSKPGTYLVICARKNHFFNTMTQQFEMFGFVKVLPGKGK